MKHRIYFLFFFCLFFQMFSTAQQNRFLYIQTENKQPFYVNINNIILSSSASGYLIIPKLQEGTYQFTIGFPKNEWPKQVVSYNIGKKDQGVLLKNFGERGWGFQNLQNSEMTMAASTSKVEAAVTEDDDNFTRVLSEVVNTPDLKIKTKVTEPVPEVKFGAQPAVPAQNALVSISRLSDNLNDQGRELVYIDDNDTIRIFIPVTAVVGEKASPIKEDTVLSVQNATLVDVKAVDTEAKFEKASEAVSIKPEAKQPVKTSGISMINSDCKAHATDEDFMKLRKKMAAEENEIKMVVVAKKAFKSKCYNTSQLKNLSFLFLNDSGRFQFFESAYPFVSDSNNFNGLQGQLTDPYYITRFEAMIRR